MNPSRAAGICWSVCGFRPLGECGGAGGGAGGGVSRRVTVHSPCNPRTPECAGAWGVGAAPAAHLTPAAGASTPPLCCPGNRRGGELQSRSGRGFCPSPRGRRGTGASAPRVRFCARGFGPWRCLPAVSGLAVSRRLEAGMRYPGMQQPGIPYRGTCTHIRGKPVPGCTAPPGPGKRVPRETSANPAPTYRDRIAKEFQHGRTRQI